MLFAARDEEAIIAIATLGCMGVVVIGALVLAVLYHLTLMRALQACSFRNRTMEPGLVWLNWVPVLSLFWQFWMPIQIGASLRREFHSRGMRGEGGYGTGLGVTLAVLGVVGAILSVAMQVGVRAVRDKEVAIMFLGIAGVFSLVQLTLWISYWVQIAGYTRRLKESPRYDDGDGYGYGGGRERYTSRYEREGGYGDRDEDDRDRRYDDRDEGSPDRGRESDDRPRPPADA